MKTITGLSDNLDVSGIGYAYEIVETHYKKRPGHGDRVDRGLMLIAELSKLGFTVVKR